MRNMFAEVLYDLARQDERIHIVVADISPAGSMAKFREEFPERFINVGVVEQSMIGICAGLALKGMRPFAYTIGAVTCLTRGQWGTCKWTNAGANHSAPANRAYWVASTAPFNSCP